MAYDVFMSHSTRLDPHQHAFADNLFEDLQKKGCRVFLDRQCLENGMPLFSTLREALRQSSTVIVLLTSGYSESAWCELELEDSLRLRNSNRLKIIALRLEPDCPIPEGIGPAEILECFSPYDVFTISGRISEIIRESLKS